MGKVVSVVASKGGVGKSTLTAHLAVQAHRMGHAVAIIDSDPQATLRYWGTRRKGEPGVIPETTPGFLSDAVKRVVDAGFDYVFIDGPGHADSTTDRAARISDLALIPCRASLADIDAVPATADLLTRLGTRYYVIANDVGARGGEADVAQMTGALESLGIKVGVTSGAPVIGSRKVYRTAFLTGQTAQEVEPTGKAADEVHALYVWVCSQLGIELEGEFYDRD